MDGIKKEIYDCAKWLAYCLAIGYKKDRLDGLTKLWWEHHETTVDNQPESEVQK